MRPHIFLSHSGEVAGSFAAAFSKLLPKEGVYLSTDRPFGVTFDQEVDAALRKATAGVVFVGPKTLQSLWVAYEVGALRVRKKPVAAVICGATASELQGSPFKILNNVNLEEAVWESRFRKLLGEVLAPEDAACATDQLASSEFAELARGVGSAATGERDALFAKQVAKQVASNVSADFIGRGALATWNPTDLEQWLEKHGYMRRDEA